MARFIAKRLLQSGLLLLGITVMSFALLRSMPGGPLAAALERPDISPADLARVRRQHGLDDPLPVQYVRWLGGLVRGHWGHSLTTGEPVIDRIWQRLPATLYLMSVALGLALLIAVPIGVLSAVHRGSWFDYLATGVALLGLSIPPFWFGLLLIVLFSVEFRWLPSSGIGTIGLEDFDLLDALKHLLMPASVLALVFTGSYTRFLRASMMDVIHHDYMRAARAKGLPEWQVLMNHGLKNALLPLVTLLGIDVAELFTGAVVTETIFAWPGMGRLYVESISDRDYNVIMAILTLSAALIILGNLLADVMYGYLDPRIRYE